MHLQVSQHQHQDHLHGSVQRQEGEARSSGVSSATGAAADLTSHHQHSRQHRPSHEPAAVSDRDHQVRAAGDPPVAACGCGAPAGSGGSSCWFCSTDQPLPVRISLELSPPDPLIPPRWSRTGLSGGVSGGPLSTAQAPCPSDGLNLLVCFPAAPQTRVPPARGEPAHPATGWGVAWSALQSCSSSTRTRSPRTTKTPPAATVQR